MERTYQDLGLTAAQAARRQVHNHNTDLMADLGVYATLKDLAQVAVQIATAEQGLFQAERAVEALDIGEYARAKEELDLATLTASMSAPADGKNAEQRKMQLDYHLATNTDVMTARANVKAVEIQRFALEGVAEAAKIALHQEQNRFKALCLTAELQNRMLALLGESVA